MSLSTIFKKEMSYTHLQLIKAQVLAMEEAEGFLQGLDSGKRFVPKPSTLGDSYSIFVLEVDADGNFSM